MPTLDWLDREQAMRRADGSKAEGGGRKAEEGRVNTFWLSVIEILLLG